MRLVLGRDAEVGQFVAARSPLERPDWSGGFVGFGIVRADGDLVAGVVFSDWHPAEKRIELSACADDPRAFSTRELVSLGNYVFGQLGAHRCWARTSEDNRRALKFLKGIGFIKEGTLAGHYGPGRNAVMMRVLAPEWKRRWQAPLRVAA